MGAGHCARGSGGGSVVARFWQVIERGVGAGCSHGIHEFLGVGCGGRVVQFRRHAARHGHSQCADHARSTRRHLERTQRRNQHLYRRYVARCCMHECNRRLADQFMARHTGGGIDWRWPCRNFGGDVNSLQGRPSDCGLCHQLLCARRDVVHQLPSARAKSRHDEQPHASEADKPSVAVGHSVFRTNIVCADHLCVLLVRGGCPCHLGFVPHQVGLAHASHRRVSEGGRHAGSRRQQTALSQLAARGCSHGYRWCLVADWHRWAVRPEHHWWSWFHRSSGSDFWSLASSWCA